MAMLNILYVTLTCPRCEKTNEVEVNLYFGYRQWLTFQIGDLYVWEMEGTPRINDRPNGAVFQMEGYAGECPNCHKDFFVTVFFDNDRIVNAEADPGKAPLIYDQHDMTNRNVILSKHSPNGRWSFVVYTSSSSPCIGVDIQNLDRSASPGALTGVGVGPYPAMPDAEVSIKWDLPDNVCGLYVNGDCYGLFRCGAGRRRTRDKFRVQTPLTEEEIAWFCAKTHIQYRRPTDQR